MVKSVVKHIFDYFFLFPNRPKFTRLKGFRRLAPINVRNAIYAPKPSALPGELHLDLFNFKDYCIVFRRKCQAENRRLKNKIQIEANEKTYNRLRNYRQSVVRFSRGSFAFLFHFQPELSGGRNSECGSDSGCRCICNRYRSPRVTVKAVKPS